MLKIVYINPAVQSALEQLGVLNERAILDWDRGQQIVKKNWADAFKCDLDGIGTVYVKRYFPQGNRILGAFRENLALREYRCSMRLARRGIPQAEPVLVATVRNPVGCVHCGLYMMREVKNAVGLDVLLEQMQQTPDASRLEAIATELKRLLDTLQRGGVCHWDLKPRNILVTRRDDGGVILTPIDARSGRAIRFYNRRACIERERRFLLREPLLRPYFEDATHLPMTMELIAADGRRHPLECRQVLRTIAGRRTVFDGVYQGRPVIIKRFEDFWGGYRCRREKRGLERLTERGIDAPAALLAGRDAAGRHILVLEKVENAVDALSAVTSGSPEAAQPILRRVVDALARMHQAGVAQYDLHLGNFLLAGERIYAIDPARMRFGGRAMSPAARCRQLAMLLATLRFYGREGQRELVERYCAAGGLDFTTAMLTQVQRLIEWRCKKLMPHVLKKTLRDSKGFFVLKTPRGRAVFNKAVFDVDAAHRLIRDLDAVFKAGRLMSQDGRRQTVVSEFEGRQLTITQYAPCSSLGVIASLFTLSPAKRDWLNAWQARYSGQFAIMPALLIAPRAGINAKKSWLITVESAINSISGQNKD